MMEHSVSVCGIVVDDEGRVLLTRRRDNGEWEPPGGGVEAHETIHEALVREVEEETSVTIAVGPLTGVYKNMSRQIVTLVFLCSPIAGTPQVTDEATEVVWFEPDVAARKISAVMAARMSNSLTFNGCVVGAHDGKHMLYMAGATATGI